MLSGSIPHFINGVSRQVDAMRLPSHLQEQINRFSAPATGNQRRPATDFVSQLGTLAGNLFYHSINRDDAERYHVLISNGDLFVYDQFGAPKTVAFPDGKTYLNAATPTAMFSAATSADYTFIANTRRAVELTPSVKSPARGSEALVYVRAVNFARTYTIKIDGQVAAQYTTPDGIDNDRPNQRKEQEAVTPINLAKTLHWGAVYVNGGVAYNGSTGGPVSAAPASINGWSTAQADGSEWADYSGDSHVTESVITRRLVDHLDPAQWSVTRYANVLHIKKLDGTPFSISVETDRDGGQDSIIAIKDRVQSFSDLPNHGPLGFTCMVVGQPTDGYDDYWVLIDKPNSDDTNDSIVWRECPKPDILIELRATTMPHVLVREADGTFTFKKATWVQRKVGDVDDNPSFVGEKINDVVFNRGRLAILTTESIVMTRPGDFFDFWRTTKTTVLDDDPIDVSGTSDNVAIFRHGISFNEDLYMFAGLSVHRLTAGDLLSPKNVALPTAVTGAINTDVAPAATTKSILFLSTSLQYGDIRELFVAPDSEETVNVSVSDHVPGYLPTTIRRMVVSDSVNTAVVTVSGTGGTVYVYQYFWSGNEKLQAAWHKWELGSTVEIIGTTFFDSDLHMITRRSDNALFLEKMSCNSNLFDTGQAWQIRLDRRVLSTALTGVVSGANTVFTLPYDNAATTVRKWGGTKHGLPVPDAVKSGAQWTIPTAELPVVFGNPFTSRMDFSRFYIREQNGQRETVLKSSPFRLRRLYIHVDATAHAKAFVQPYTNGPIYSSTYAPFTMDDAAFSTDKVALGNGYFSLPIKARSDRVKIWMENDTVYPDTITGVEWEGEYDIRARRT